VLVRVARALRGGRGVMPRPPDARARYHDPGETEDPGVLERERWKRVTEAVSHAYRTLAFYRERFDRQGFVPSGVDDPATFAARVPLTRKQDLVAATRTRGTASIGIEALDGARTSNIVMTSGTGGFNTFAALTRDDLTGANLLGQARELWMIGVRPGMRVVTMSPAWHILALVESEALTHLGARPVVPWGTYLPRFAPHVLDAILAHRPEHVLATVPVFDALLDECRRRSLDPRAAFASVRYVGCAGQALTLAYRRRLIETMGLDDLYERGGSSDGMFGGGECEAHRGHHIFADLHYVEIVDPDSGALLPPGERGVAVVTNLTRGRSVYIRFDTGDVAEVVPGPCPCGRTHPVVEFYGRLDDCVRVGGRIVAPVDVRRTLDHWEALAGRPVTLAPLGRGDGLEVEVREGILDLSLRDAVERRLSDDLGTTVRVTSVSAGTTRGWKGQTMRADPA
jgi:phenylacetate-CoA ligase